MIRAGLVGGAIAGVWLAFSSGAQAATISSGSLGSARGCTDPACANRTLNLVMPNPTLAGTLTFNATTLQLEFDITLASAMFTPASGLGGADNGVTSLEFQNVRYRGTGSLLFLASTQTWMISGGTTDVDGTAVPTGAGSPSTIDVTSSISGSCAQGAGLTTCGIILNSPQFAVQVNGATRYFANTLNVTAPEPAAIGLFGLALGALLALRSRRIG